MESFSYKQSKNAQSEAMNHILDDVGNEKRSSRDSGRVAEILLYFDSDAVVFQRPV
jgi:hypothetical protein